MHSVDNKLQHPYSHHQCPRVGASFNKANSKAIIALRNQLVEFLLHSEDEGQTWPMVMIKASTQMVTLLSYIYICTYVCM